MLLSAGRGMEMPTELAWDGGLFPLPPKTWWVSLGQAGRGTGG